MAANYLKSALLLVLIVLTGCFSRTSAMTYSEYDKVKVGTPIAEVQEDVGKPYAIHNKAEGTQEYEYVERIEQGNRLFTSNHYFLIVSKGKVIGKYMNQEAPPAYELIYQPQPNYPDTNNYPP